MNGEIPRSMGAHQLLRKYKVYVFTYASLLQISEGTFDWKSLEEHIQAGRQSLCAEMHIKLLARAVKTAPILPQKHILPRTT